MNGNRLQNGVALLILCGLVHTAGAEPLPSFQQLDAATSAPRKLRATPAMLARFPTTLSIAVCADRNRMRTVDINGRVWQWTIEGSTKPSLVTETNCEPACGVLSNDARWLAFAEPAGDVVVWDFDASQNRFRDSATTERTVALTFSPDGRLLAGVTVNGAVRMWDVGSGKVIRELTAEPSPLQTLAFSPDGGQLAVASYSPDLKLYEVDQENRVRPEREPKVIRAGSSRITTFAFAPDGKQLVIATADGAANVYEPTTGLKVSELGTYPFAIWSLAFEPDGKSMAAGSWDGTIKLWETRSWKPTQSLKVHEESVAALVYDPELGVVSTGLDGRLLHWLPEVPPILPFGMIAGRADSVWVAAYSPDGRKLFVGGQKKRFELWDLEQNEMLLSRDGPPTTRCAAFSPDGKMLATGGDDGSIFLCDGATGEVRKTLLRHRGAVSAVIFAEEGRTLVSGCDGGYVKLWDTATGQEKGTWKEHRKQIYCASLSPDGRQLVTGGGDWTTGDPGELLVWEFPTGRVRARVDGHKLAVWSIVFTRDGGSFASSDSSGAVKVWNFETLEEERVLQHSTWVRGLSLTPDGKTLAVGRGDGSVRLWDTATWTERGSCDGHDRFAFSLQFAPDGKTLASSGSDGTVRFWRMSVK